MRNLGSRLLPLWVQQSELEDGVGGESWLGNLFTWVSTFTFWAHRYLIWFYHLKKTAEEEEVEDMVDDLGAKQ